MKAVLCKDWGDPSTLAVEEVERPAPGANEVRISVRAAGVNPVPDNLIVAGLYQFKPPLPFSPGFGASGVVVEVGEGVEGLAPGDRAMVALPYGGFAEEVVAPVAHALKIPDGMGFEEAAAFPLAYATAHLALLRRARLKEQQTLLVLGASGNVGRAAVGVGKRLGAFVIAAAGSPENLEVAAGHGADRLVDYGREDLRDRVLELTGGGGADVVFDPVGGDAFDASTRCVAWEGTVLTIGFASGRIPEVPAWRVLLKNCAVMGTDWGGYLRREPEAVRAATEEALRWYAEGGLRPTVALSAPLEQAADVLAAGAVRRASGKVVLTAG